ncbi:hypothetical protein [Actinoplanes sp. L3-i22]|uniref:hypothetical protein n=1 Tax=Actinoplanes sp. L3-i22 TaxID=2836373 RepID=UPI001C78F962|nr:hypothetical protein [Actinoplanes sp. L3-i22]BCY10106.1 hypothetical protein L3i22_051940 [Actinoplanes sp. L3-i22]
MSALTVSYLGRETTLRRQQTATFGRDEACEICLDPDDLVLSRRAGEFGPGPHGSWRLLNLSRKQTLHLLDGEGAVRPLPPTIPPAEPVAWPLTGEAMTVHVLGEDTVHTLELRLTAAAGAAPAWPGAVPPLTDERRTIVAALGAGYLRDWASYEPRPRPYRDAAVALGLPESKVVDEIGRLRRVLGRAGVLPELAETDPRRLVVEWLIALGRVTAADLRPLPAGSADPVRRTTRVPSDLVGPTVFSTTTHPLHDEVVRIAEATARHVGPHLQARLVETYGEEWPEAVRRDRRATLRDYRLCLALLGHDACTVGWASAECRDDARRLNRLANAAAHRSPLSGDQVQQARMLGARIRERF